MVECGDVTITPFDNRYALSQLYRVQRAVLKHNSTTDHYPRIVTLGGDHSITFSALRAINEVHGKVAVVHFDSHIDTWDPIALGGKVSNYTELKHRTFLHYAHEQGFLLENNIHVGARAPYIRKYKDIENDNRCGFSRALAREIDEIEIKEIVNRIKSVIGDAKVYI